MRKTGGIKKYILSLTLVLLLPSALSGCMEAGAEDWIGYTPKEATEEAEVEKDETVSEETVGEVDGGDKEIENSLPTYSPEEEPAEIEEEDIEEELPIEEEPVEEDSTVSEDEAPEEDEGGDNHDVTRGSWDDDDWLAEATIGENNEIKVTVTAVREAMKIEKITDHSPASEKAGGNIDDVRFEYYTRYQDGDREAAAGDVEDYEDVDKMSDKQLSALMAVSDDIGKLIAQFGITAYDFNHPAENDDDEVVMDLYNGDKYQFLMTLSFDEDHPDKLLSIEFALEE